MDTPTLLAHLQTRGEALSLPRGGTLCWDDADFHRAAYTAGPERYALLGLAPGVRPWQRARVLLQVLAASHAGLDDTTRATLARTARVLTLALPPAHVVTVLLGLRRLRANHKHTTRTALRFVLEHPGADALIAARRPALVDCFEHALGKATARGCARRVAEGDTGSDYLQRRLLRFLTAPDLALPRVRALYATAEPTTAEPTTGTDRDAGAADPVHRGDPAEDPCAALGRHLNAAVPPCHRFEGALTLVLDTGTPAPGHDGHSGAPPQAAALRTALAETCAHLEVIEIGGAPAPRVAADLATAVLDALAAAPDLVAVVPGGHEDHHPGDLARIIAALPHTGVTTPVVFCHPAPGGHDPAPPHPAPPHPAPPRRGLPNHDDLAGLLPWMLGHCDAGAPWLRAALHARLDALDRQADRLLGVLPA
ncbi:MULTISPECIES: hypothetical protein [Thermomonosporaceae]|uniref:hypothetical protein n=1 Tax=Thermomonosporaceae TaxID=2012 RepID=UPI00255A9988|nr:MULTISPECIES: hypothetical protein [Thermomonosporaceae]MDL4776645.1 hypothetical protein [Actinomadura xylanilytica]